MVFFPDLSPREDGALYVGWLAPEGPFPTGSTSEGFREALFRRTQLSLTPGFGVEHQLDLRFLQRVAVLSFPAWGARAVFALGGTDPQPAPAFMHTTFGRHGCFRCQDDYDFPHDPIRARRGDVELQLGGGEVQALSAQGVVLSAPDLLYHYVVEHDYLPPAEFVEALLGGLDDRS